MRTVAAAVLVSGGVISLSIVGSTAGKHSLAARSSEPLAWLLIVLGFIALVRLGQPPGVLVADRTTDDPALASPDEPKQTT